MKVIQTLVGSTWEADQMALQGLLNFIVAINNRIAKDPHGNLDGFRKSAAKIIHTELEARKEVEYCSLSSFLSSVYEKLWFATYSPFRGPSAFQEAHAESLPFHLPPVPMLFGEDLDAIREKGKAKCLVQALYDFVGNYLEPKYASGTLLNEHVASQMPSLQDMQRRQDEFKRILQQKIAAAEKVPESSAVEAAVETEQGETQDEEVESDLDDEKEATKEELLGKPVAEYQISQTSGPARLVEWRTKVLLSKLMAAGLTSHVEEGDRPGDGDAQRILRETLETDIGAYKRLRQFIGKHKKTKERKWYCVRTIGTEPGSTKEAERLHDNVSQMDTHCGTCRTQDSNMVCLQVQSSGRGKGEKKLAYAGFFCVQ